MVAAVAGYINHRLLRLPAATATLAVALASSLALMAVDHVFPRLGFVHCGGRVLNEIDFNDTLMHGMLSFLLFAGALHVDLEGLLAVVHYRAGGIVKTRFDGREQVRNL